MFNVCACLARCLHILHNDRNFLVTGERRKPKCTLRTTALASTEAHGKEIVRLEVCFGFLNVKENNG